MRFGAESRSSRGWRLLGEQKKRLSFKLHSPHAHGVRHDFSFNEALPVLSNERTNAMRRPTDKAWQQWQLRCKGLQVRQANDSTMLQQMGAQKAEQDYAGDFFHFRK